MEQYFAREQSTAITYVEVQIGGLYKTPLAYIKPL